MTTERDILIFGGTAEGRQLVEWLDTRGTCHVVACTATEYGASLLPGGEHVQVLQGPLSPDQKQQIMSEHDFACIVDATHPFALHISESVAALAASHGVDLLRIEREHIEDGPWHGVANAEEAAAYLATTTGNILLTTGSKDLAAFTQAIPHFETRLWVRVLPVQESLAHATQLGIPTDHIIAMQGPFSQAFNSALIRELNIAHLVTKQSGTTGGFAEKVAAADECNIELVVILRPAQEAGLSLDEAKRELEKRYGF